MDVEYRQEDADLCLARCAVSGRPYINDLAIGWRHEQFGIVRGRSLWIPEKVHHEKSKGEKRNGYPLGRWEQGQEKATEKQNTDICEALTSNSHDGWFNGYRYKHKKGIKSPFLLQAK